MPSRECCDAPWNSPDAPGSVLAVAYTVLDAQRVGLIRNVERPDDETVRKAPTASLLSLLGLGK